MRQVRGFTLIELVVAVAIVGVLALMAAPLMEMTAKRQKEAELRLDLRQIRGAIDAYHEVAMATNPKRLDLPADSSRYPPDLETLVKGVTDISSPDGKKIFFLRRLPRDPFNADKEADAAATWGKRSYQSEPDDPREGEDVFDVYSLSDQSGINGVPYKEW